MKYLDKLKVGSKEIYKGLTVYDTEYKKGDEFYRNIVRDIYVEEDGKISVSVIHPDSDAPFDSGSYIDQFMEHYKW
jgi:hypothetical protein